MALFATEVVFAAIVLVAYGRGLLTFPAWVATSFSVAVLGQVAYSVHIVTHYLFSERQDSLLQTYISRLPF